MTGTNPNDPDLSIRVTNFKAIAGSNFTSSEQLFWVTSVQKIEKIYPLV
jgi:hypothetical protein